MSRFFQHRGGTAECAFRVDQIGRVVGVAAGAVVKGKFEDDSLIMGNPAKKIMNTKIQKRMYLMSPAKFDLKKMTDQQKRKVLKERFQLQN